MEWVYRGLIMRDCIGENPKPITVEEWNEERQKHHKLANLYFTEQVDLLCKSCGSKVLFQEHYDFSRDYPYRQAVCSNKNCGVSSYVMA